MFEHVQKRLTLLYTAITGSILVILLGCVFLWNINRKEQENEAAFQGLWFSVSSRVQLDQLLTDTYLAQTEFSTRSIIQVEENGTPLLFPGSWSPRTPREQLIEKAYAQAASDGVLPHVAPVSSSVVSTSTFYIKGENKDMYRCRLSVTATRNGAKSLLLLTYVTPHAEYLWQGLGLFLVSCAAGILGILIVSWFFTGWSLKPARDGAKKQAEFIASASHELRSPLAVIRAGISALRSVGEERDEVSPAAKLLDGIDRECARMGRLVGDMLLLASSDAGNWSLAISEVDMDTMLIEIYETFLPLCQKRGLNLSLDLPQDALPTLRADRQRIEQVLSILLDNAVSYTPKGGTVRLKAYTENKKYRAAGKELPGLSERPRSAVLVLEVEDSGPGIPDENKKRVFERFYRADASRTDKSHFGLGLPIARELIELHRGTIRVLDSPSGGCRFVIKF